ncbi:ATP-binding protein [Schnuerera sp. xch1]|uniref:ATP-binding protein n=1 Tax=Schnuerera sp. xch1 TaxID=2874283 RepID=UPI001CBACF47|nr:ATP-binding protein [Schnuerera sp. xch1]MBZ2175418.1 ATP-binding protein [Schnuerera sp. xch1]
MYNQILKDILNKYENKRDRAINEQKLRIKKVYEKVPEIRKLDKKITETGLLMSKAIIEDPGNYEESMKDVKERLEKLKMEKAYLLTENNIPLDYLDVKYECSKCQDTGYLPNGNKCNCLKQSFINKAYEMSNIEGVLKKENFQTFDINIFPDEPFEEESMTPRDNMKNISSISEGFVNNFDENNDENLLFYGTTGLGKTFMCNCIAKALLDKNKIVIYQTAFKILEIIEKRRFGRDSKRFKDEEYDLLFDAELLIIDDLGTELSNTFTNTEIFNIVNTRLLGSKRTIISTNLTPKEISDTYTDRIFSRILEKFIPLRFFGPDLRYYRWQTQ